VRPEERPRAFRFRFDCQTGTCSAVIARHRVRPFGRPDDRLRETIQSHARDSGLLPPSRKSASADAVVANAPRNDGGRGHTFSFSRRNSSELCIVSTLLKNRGCREGRVAAAPGAPAQKIFARARKPQVQAVTTGLPCAVVLRLIRALLGEPSRLPPSPPRSFSASLGLSTKALGRQDHTTSPSASASFVFDAFTSTTSPPHVRDVRETPLCKRSGMSQPYIRFYLLKNENPFACWS
jgi:hypothetical protein